VTGDSLIHQLDPSVKDFDRVTYSPNEKRSGVPGRRYRMIMLKWQIVRRHRKDQLPFSAETLWEGGLIAGSAGKEVLLSSARTSDWPVLRFRLPEPRECNFPRGEKREGILIASDQGTIARIAAIPRRSMPSIARKGFGISNFCYLREKVDET